MWRIAPDNFFIHLSLSETSVGPGIIPVGPVIVLGYFSIQRYCGYGDEVSELMRGEGRLFYLGTGERE